MDSLKKLTLIALLFTFFLATSCSDDEDSPAVVKKEITLKTHTTFGQYLADGDGKTLYFFTKDTDGESACNGGCLSAWPVFNMENIQVGSGLAAGDFKTITRADGSKQITYKGWPLYYFAGDAAVGQINGDGADNVWYVAKPDYSIMIANLNATEQYLVDGSGRTLYYFTNDGENTSTCSGGCVTNWPVYLDESLTLPSVLSAAGFTTITREDGAKQTSFQGKPLYYFSQDQERGERKGQGVNDKWFIVKSFQ